MNNEISLALDDVTHAFQHLEFAIKLMCYCELDHLDRSKFDSDVTILLEKENVRFPPNTFQTLDSVVLASQANVGVCFGTTAIILDAAFEAADIPRRPLSHAPADELRTLVYMVRCAFAHNPAMPCWNAKKLYARSLSLPLGSSSAFSMDLAALNDKPFEYEHIGGFANWFLVRTEVERVINAANLSSERTT
jgi:hypothetical protein